MDKVEALFFIAFLVLIRLIAAFYSPNKGAMGERLIRKRLERFTQDGGKPLSNIYLPKINGGTTEIDLLLIHPKGLFVFESKNYNGYIFGNERHQNWTQTLPKNWYGDVHKERFYNPIMQNASHIKHLMYNIEKNIPIWSIVVFSDECELKDITVSSKNVRVIQCRHVTSTIEQICNETPSDFLLETEIFGLYNHLLAYTIVSQEEKGLHAQKVLRVKQRLKILRR